jgi:hypothetical protein
MTAIYRRNFKLFLVTVTYHRKQFNMHVRVKGKGIDFALLVSITDLKDESGLINRTIQTNTANLPIKVAAKSLPRVTATSAVSVTTRAL